MPTKFALAELVVRMSDGKKIAFWFDGNGKITLDHGNFANPCPNAFSLVQVEDCPFATPTCISVCYVHNLEKAEREVHDKYRLNGVAIRRALENRRYQAETEEAFAEWIIKNAPRGFRWHVSGDIFSLAYSHFIKNVSVLASEVPFWIYTRSFSWVEPLLEAKNLAVNLSADKDNYEEALFLNRRFGLRVCYLSVDGEVPDLPKGSVIFPNYTLRGRDLLKPIDAPWWQSLAGKQRKMVCPPDFFGQSERFRCGPCKKCLK